MAEVKRKAEAFDEIDNLIIHVIINFKERGSDE